MDRYRPQVRREAELIGLDNAPQMASQGVATVTYRLHDGRELTLDAPLGQSLMQTAVDHGIAGMDAECGGACACATCHVYVDEGFVGHIPAPAEMELEMLDFIATERRPNSRLACQLTMTGAMGGIVVQVPSRQR